MTRKKLLKIFVLTVVLAAAITIGLIKSGKTPIPAYANPITLDSNMTAEWSDGGWIITLTLTDPGTVTGTIIPLQATATYYRDDIELSTESNIINLTVGDSVYKKVWNISTATSTNYTITNGSGNGGAEFITDGSMKFWVSTKNDGNAYSYSFKIVRK
jgi:hypothetical protein